MGGGSKTTVQQSSTTSALDKETQSRLANVAERQQALAEDQYAQFIEVFKPFEQDLISANRDIIPINRDLVSAEFRSQLDLLPQRTEIQRMGLEETARDIELGRPIKEALQTRQLDELRQTGPVVEQFLEEAQVGGKELGNRFAAEATGDVAQQFALSRGQLTRDIGRSGLNIRDPRFSNLLAKLTVEEAKTRVGAITRGRRMGEDVAFQRLGQGAQFAGRATGLPGIGSLQNVAPGALPFQEGAIQLGGFGDPAARALAGYGGAASTFEAGGTRTTTGTATTRGPSPGALEILGGVAGAGAGSFMGGYGGAMGAKVGAR